MHRSYVAKTWVDSFIADERVLVPDEVAARFFTVLRIKADEEVAVFDGEGREIIGRLVRIATGAHFVHARVRSETAVKPALVVMQAACDDAKISETIKRGTEFGVDGFVIFAARRSDKFCFDKLVKRHDRLMRIAEDAARQAGRLFVPSIHYASTIQEALASVIVGLGIFGDVRTGLTLSQLLTTQTVKHEPTVIAIGPEGGLHPDEMLVLSSAGFHGVRFAPHVLRTELAALAPVAILNAFYGRA